MSSTSVVRQTNRYIGVSVEYLKRVHLRVEMESFRKELLHDQGLVIGRFDSRFSGPDPGTTGEYDPATAGVNGGFRSLAHAPARAGAQEHHDDERLLQLRELVLRPGLKIAGIMSLV